MTCHTSLNTDENKRTSFTAGQKRKQSSLSAQVYDISSPTSSTNVTEQHLSVSAAEEYEMPVRKRRRADSFEKLLSLKSIKWSSSSSDQASTHRHAESKPNDRLTMCRLTVFCLLELCTSKSQYNCQLDMSIH